MQHKYILITFIDSSGCRHNIVVTAKKALITPSFDKSFSLVYLKTLINTTVAIFAALARLIDYVVNSSAIIAKLASNCIIY